MFKKGNTYGSKTKRGKNKNTSEIRQLFTDIISKNIDEAERRLSELDNVQFFRAYGMMLKHVLPQQKQIEMEVDKEEIHYQIEIIDRIDQVTNKQAEDVLDSLAEAEIKKKHNV